MDPKFKINKQYADKYDDWRRKEELGKLKSKYGDADELDSSSSSESSDDSDAEALTSQVETDWLKTLAALKRKDPKIYNKDQQFYKRDESKPSGSESKAPKGRASQSMTLKDYERKVILEKGGHLSDDSSDGEEEEITRDPGYYEEQEKIKEELKKAAGAGDEDDEDSDDDLLTKRKKSKEEKKKEEADYHEWLKGQKQELSDDTEVGTDLVTLKEYWNDPELDHGEKFLRDYFLNKRYIEKDDDGSVPTYDEIVADDDMSEEEELLTKQEDFERKYNFRFEEPDSEFIKKYPRTIDDSMRRKDNKRSTKRVEVKQRKQEEKEKKKEEIRQLKNLKKKEILTKIEHLKEITGNQELGFSIDDMEGDFDPAEHDKRMQELFDNQYYNDDADEETKPVFSDDETGAYDENWDDWHGNAEQGEDYSYEGGDGDDYNAPNCEDPNFNMDADYDPQQDRTFGLDGTSKKQKKRMSKFAKALNKKKPVFDPNEKTFEQYFNEYYKLDYEDIVADMPVRFKYRSVVPNDFGLSVEEVLSAKDKELNSWVSVKKMSQYRGDDEEMHDKKVFQMKATNMKKKLNILSSLKAKREDDERATITKEPSESKKTKSKKRKHNESESVKKTESDAPIKSGNNSEIKGKESKQTDEMPKKKRKRNKKSKVQSETGTKSAETINKNELGENRINSDESNSKNGTSSQMPKSENKTDVPDNTNVSKKHKKKKNKKKTNLTMTDERLKAFGIDPKKYKYTMKNKINKKINT
ncbi:unnamed protein product [Owenia fusiformis]|uniref:Protein KRI1 homolog n=1 Tax=Owenia fusiformis TaxID=6347 RepID=A0A8S4N2L2_OWEFU|nr:unnamed protein product [Owenia fusiformis]